MIENLTNILIRASDRHRLEALEVHWQATLRQSGEFAPIIVSVRGQPVGNRLSYKVAEHFVRFLEAQQFPVSRV